MSIGGFTNAQVDAILDVIDECRHVTEAWEKCKNLASLVLHEAEEELDRHYIIALELGVEDEVLTSLICRNTPEKVLSVHFHRRQHEAA